jgi:hypothetical protein
MTQQRIKVELKTSFVTTSPLGEVFSYLKRNYGDDWRDVIANAVFAFYRPAAVAELRGSSAEVEDAILRAQNLINEKALAARINCHSEFLADSPLRSTSPSASPCWEALPDDHDFFDSINPSQSLEEEDE